MKGEDAMDTDDRNSKPLARDISAQVVDALFDRWVIVKRGTAQQVWVPCSSGCHMAVSVLLLFVVVCRHFR